MFGFSGNETEPREEWVERKEKTREGSAAERRRVRFRRGAAWVPYGKARTATWRTREVSAIAGEIG